MLRVARTLDMMINLVLMFYYYSINEARITTCMMLLQLQFLDFRCIYH